MPRRKFVVEREEFVNKTFRIEKRLAEEMQLVCDERGISMNKLLVLCVQFALENMEDKPQR